ncbi:hypothetical protein ACRS9B_12115 [Achromobacter xylosoxidans]
MNWSRQGERGDLAKLLERQLYTWPIQPGCELENSKGVKNAA